MLFGGLLLLELPGCAVQPPSLPPDSFPLVELISARLALAKEVARAKREAGLPVRDLAREDVVVMRLAEQAYAAGLSPGAALRLIRAQIEASCREQERWMKEWTNGGKMPSGEPPDLEGLRQQLDRISSRILAEWAAVEGIPLPGATLKARLVQDGYSVPAATAAAAFAH